MPDQPTAGDWTQHDPWIRESMRRDDLLAHIEEGVLTALARAIRDWFIRVRDAVLGTTTGAGTRDTPPDLDAWPQPDQWWQLLGQHLVSAMRTAYRAAVRDIAPNTDKDRTLPSFVDHITTAWRDILTWPAHTYDTARNELDTSRAAGDSVRQQRRNLDLLLRINAPNQQRREQAAAYRRAGRPVPKSVLRGDDAGDYAWHNQARVDARWLTVETANVATLDGARQQQDTTGEPLYKGWMATTDQRVRPAHWHANKQAVPLDEPFTVGGHPMAYPGDTSAPPALWKNCRCTLTVNTKDEADQLNNERKRELPNRTDVHGNPVAASAAVTAADCYETCESATSAIASCECLCSGTNHGRSHMSDTVRELSSGTSATEAQRKLLSRYEDLSGKDLEYLESSASDTFAAATGIGEGSTDRERERLISHDDPRWDYMDSLSYRKTFDAYMRREDPQEVLDDVARHPDLAGYAPFLGALKYMRSQEVETQQSFTAFAAIDQDLADTLRKGDSFTQESFTGASIAPHFDGRAERAGAGLMIEVPAGTRIVPANYELGVTLLPDGAEMTITGVVPSSETANGIPYVKATITNTIDQKEKNEKDRDLRLFWQAEYARKVRKSDKPEENTRQPRNSMGLPAPGG